MATFWLNTPVLLVEYLRAALLWYYCRFVSTGPTPCPLSLILYVP